MFFLYVYQTTMSGKFPSDETSVNLREQIGNNAYRLRRSAVNREFAFPKPSSPGQKNFSDRS